MIRSLILMLFTLVLFAKLSGETSISLSENSVNVVTGTYVESNEDIMVPGPLPFVLKRQFSSEREGYPLARGWSWHIQTQAEIEPYDQHRLHLVPKTDESKRLIQVQVQGAGNGQTLSWARLDHSQVAVHDGQLWALEVDGDQLRKVTAPGGEFISYEYEGSQISKRKTSQGHILENEFYTLGRNQVGTETVNINSPHDPRIGKVKLQKALVSTDAEPLIIARYFYRKGETEVVDARGARKIYTIEGGRVTEVKTFDEKGIVRKEAFAWDGSRLLSQSVFDSSDQLIKGTFFQYDDQGRLTCETLRGNLRGKGIESYSRYQAYSESGNLIKEWEDNGRYVRYQYDPASSLVRLAESGCGDDCYFRTEFAYDELGILTSISQYNIKKDRIKDTLITPSDAPHSAGLPMMIEEVRWDEESDERIQKTQLYTYAMRGKIEQQTIIDNDAQTRRVVRKEYDDFGREIYSSDTADDEFTTIYTPEKNTVVRTNLSDGEVNESLYNFQKRVTYRKITKSDGTVLEQSNRYDEKGNLLTSKDVLGNETHYRYDQLGRLIEKRDPEVLDQDDNPYCPINRYEYDALNQLIAHTNPNGHTTRYFYTARGKPYRIEYPDGTTDLFEYGTDGLLCQHTARDGLTLIYERDPYGNITDTYVDEKKEKPKKQKKIHKTRPISKEDSAQAEEHLEYTYINDRGQRALQKFLVQENGIVVISTMDALGRVEQVEMLSSMGSLMSKKICRYDGVGNLVLQKDFVIENGASTGLIETRWSFGPGDQMIEKVEFAHTNAPRITRYAYNRHRRLKEVAKPDGTTLFYDYDQAGQLIRLTSSDKTVDLEYRYDEGHPIQAADHANGLAVTREYSQDRRMTREVLAGGLEILNSYDDQGRKISMTLPDGSGALYEYGDENIRAIHRTSVDGSVLYTHGYTRYQDGFLAESKLIGNLGKLKIRRDSARNITSIYTPYWSQKAAFAGDKISHVATHDQKGTIRNDTSVNDLGQLTKEGSDSYSYDSVDNMLSFNKNKFHINNYNQVVHFDGVDYGYDQNGNLAAKKEGDKATTFFYDALDRLILVNTGSQTIRYTYDPFHRRASKQINEEDPIYYLYDESHEIGTCSHIGTLKEFRLLGLGYGAEIGAAISIEINGKTYAPIHDHRGSVAAIVDLAAKKTVETYRYSAFGLEKVFDEKGKPKETPINPWRFSSKRFEEESKLVSFGKRDYDPRICRWTSQDPLGFFDSVNRYAFSRNNPLQNVDLHGLFSVSCLWEGLHAAGQYINRKVCESWQDCSERFQIVETAHQMLDDLGHYFVGPDYMFFAGFHTSESESGVYGGGFEPHDRYRITFVNGILTRRDHMITNLQTISESHGGCNIHYCYVGTNGWTNDLIRSLFMKIGVTSPETKELARIWRQLIQELGGVQSGGIIFHYAHSLGGTETLLASYLMSPEELKMIRVITMGSPTLIPDNGFHSVINIISCRDIISIFDPMRFFYSLLFETNNFFVGSHWDGWPIVDHPFFCYWTYLQEQFWEEYEELLDNM